MSIVKFGGVKSYTRISDWTGVGTPNPRIAQGLLRSDVESHLQSHLFSQHLVVFK